MSNEGLFDDVDEFNQACRVLYYLLTRARGKDGTLMTHDFQFIQDELEEALTRAVEVEPRWQRRKEGENA